MIILRGLISERLAMTLGAVRRKPWIRREVLRLADGFEGGIPRKMRLIRCLTVC